ncbi:uncharacterized protein LOC128266558 [Drosophila gunungcola]|uniref:Uncharacterized protein n=1 Tax=Drosophila gunungcola TaxID=103775 RepID=A0A9Q0BUA9_9MUSC|nr:uncharacterized protein LOC128266558 [Drosophila gunungcola]KAI8044074.1 hypothetical protein M5D96_000224 [Drosophila gunungcola]
MLIRNSLVALLIMYYLGCQVAANGDFPVLPEPQCSDCQHIQSKCTISKSGVFCTNNTDKINIHFSKGKADQNLDLDACVPEKYAIKGPILDWCCFWTPKLGCQQLAGTLYQNHSDCGICRHSCVCDEDKDNGVVRLSPTRWGALLGFVALLPWICLQS